MTTSILQDCQRRLTMTSIPVSLWDISAEETEISQPFKPDSNVDVAIVGGGFTGLSTALHCAEKGLSVQLFEAEQVGYGGSGRNCGLVNAALWLPPAQVREKLGETYGPRFIKQFGKGPEYVFSLIRLSGKPRRLAGPALRAGS